MRHQLLVIGFLTIVGLLLLSVGLAAVFASDDGWLPVGHGDQGADASSAGSTQLTLAVVPPAGEPLTASLTAAVSHGIWQRANALGLRHARVARHGRGRIIVVIPPVPDLNRVVTTLTQQQLLEIVDPQGVSLATGTIVTTTYAPPGSPAGPSGTPATANAVYETIVTSADLVKTEIVTDPVSHQQELVLLFTKAAGERLASFTRAHLGQPIAIVIAKRVVVSPIIQGTISTSAAIAGTSRYETHVLYELLQAANLPAGVEIISERGIQVATPAPATPAPTAVPTPTPIIANGGPLI